MSRILLIGAGPLGRATLPHLLENGDEVLLATRSGTRLPGTTPITADITSPGFADAVPAVDGIIAASNFPYGTWARNWPPAITHMLALAEREHAVFVLAGSIYSYGPPAGPMRESDPLTATYTNGRMRTEVWQRTLATHRAGLIRATEIRGSDYVGVATGPNAHGGDRVLVPALAGRTVRPLGSPDQPHTWTATADFGRMLARAVHDESMWGRPWHVPSAPACTQRELISLALRLAGRTGDDAVPRIRAVPSWTVHAAGLVSPGMRGLADALYQFEAPFVMDDSDARTLLGETHTPLEETLSDAVAALDPSQPSFSHGAASRK